MLIDLPNLTEKLTPLGRSLPAGTSRHIIADGVRGTAQTIEMMQKLVNAGKRDNDIRKLVGNILNPVSGQRSCDSKDFFCYAKILYEWVRDNILYAYDPHMVEYIEKPSILLQNRIGDCDSMDILLCSMFEQVGLQSQFVTIKADPTRTDEYTHVYTRVMIPKVGWVVADPIMPKKWFGWEPPYPNGKRYWAASADALDQPVDSSDSVPFPSPNGAPQTMDIFGDVTGMSGFGAIQMRSIRKTPRLSDWEGGVNGLGHGHHGGGHSHGNFVAYGDNSLVPIGIPIPDQITVVRDSEVQPQQIESIYEENFGMQGFGGILDVIQNTVGSAVAKVQSAVGIKSLSDSEGKYWITRILDGTEAANLMAARKKANDAVDAATKVLQAARGLPDSNPKKQTAVNAATATRSAAYELQYAVNDAMGKYNEVAAAISGLSFDNFTLPKLSGLGAYPPAIVTVAVGSVLVMSLVYAYQLAAVGIREKELVVEKQRLDMIKAGVSPEAINGAFTPTSQPQSQPCSWSNPSACLDKVGGQIFSSALVLGGLFVLYKVFDAGVIQRVKPKSNI